jgi:hypothetical protein
VAGSDVSPRSPHGVRDTLSSTCQVLSLLWCVSVHPERITILMSGGSPDSTLSLCARSRWMQSTCRWARRPFVHPVLGAVVGRGQPGSVAVNMVVPLCASICHYERGLRGAVLEVENKCRELGQTTGRTQRCSVSSPLLKEGSL